MEHRLEQMIEDLARDIPDGSDRGFILKSIRRAAGYTRLDVATITGIQARELLRIEQGVEDITEDKLALVFMMIGARKLMEEL